MDLLAQRVLRVFDELARDTLDLATLADCLTSPKDRTNPTDLAALRAAVRELLGHGLLRPAGAADYFARTEEGRLALAAPLEVTLYTRPGCHLCEEAKAQMAPLLQEFGATLREINIDADPVLRDRYTDEVPVVFLGARKVAKHRVALDQFRRQLASARR